MHASNLKGVLTPYSKIPRHGVRLPVAYRKEGLVIISKKEQSLLPLAKKEMVTISKKTGLATNRRKKRVGCH